MGPDADVSPTIRSITTVRMLDRAHILGAAMRVGYLISAAMPGVLPRCPMTCAKTRLVLSVPKEMAPLVNERLNGRLKQMGKLIGREPMIKFLE